MYTEEYRVNWEGDGHTSPCRFSNSSILRYLTIFFDYGTYTIILLYIGVDILLLNIDMIL